MCYLQVKPLFQELKTIATHCSKLQVIPGHLLDLQPKILAVFS